LRASTPGPRLTRRRMTAPPEIAPASVASRNPHRRPLRL
jgi:hypothetical protein